MHEPTRLSSYIMLLAKLSRAFLVGLFNTSDDCSQSQPSKPFKTIINIKRYPLLNQGIFPIRKPCPIWSENKTEAQSLDRFNWSGQECLLDNIAIIIFQMISCREVLYSIKT